jgi:competence protein ComEA
LGALVLGRVLDALDLPFEQRQAPAPIIRTPAVGLVPAPPLPGPPESLRIAPPGPAASRVRSTSRAGAAAADTLPVRINVATADELQRLPGVGPVLAARIVEERVAGGPFRTPADLRRVRGIGAKTGARLAPRLRFD